MSQRALKGGRGPWLPSSGIAGVEDAPLFKIDAGGRDLGAVGFWDWREGTWSEMTLRIARDCISWTEPGAHRDGRGPSARLGRSWALGAKDHPAQFIAKALRFLRVGGVAESLREFKELLLLAIFRLDAVFNEFDEHAVGAKPASLGQAAHLCCDVCREADALAYGLVCGAHDTSMHQNGAFVQASG